MSKVAANFDKEYEEKAYQTIVNMTPGKKFGVRLLTGMTGFGQGFRPREFDSAAMWAIVRADQDELIMIARVASPNSRGGYAFEWERLEDE